MTVVFDVNVIVSAVIAPLGASRLLFSRFRDGSMRVVISPGMIQEVRAKLTLPRIAGRYHLTPADAEAVVQLLITQAALVEVPAAQLQVVTGDPEDDYVLATCVSSGAAYLITGDKGLLALQSHHGTAIMTPKAALDIEVQKSH